jgi:ADP-ribose pyrophosphatase
MSEGREESPTGGYLLERREIHQGRTIRVSQDTVRFPDGATGVLDHIRHPGAAAIVPFLDPPGTTDPRIVLLRQFRYSVGGPIVEVPAGTRSSPEENLDACARRELEEETGYRAGHLVRLGRIFTTPGFTDEVIYLYAAWDLSEGDLRRDGDEYMDLLTLPLSRVLAMIREGEIVDAKSICALHMAVSYPDLLEG